MGDFSVSISVRSNNTIEALNLLHRPKIENPHRIVVINFSTLFNCPCLCWFLQLKGYTHHVFVEIHMRKRGAGSFFPSRFRLVCCQLLYEFQVGSIRDFWSFDCLDAFGDQLGRIVFHFFFLLKQEFA